MPPAVPVETIALGSGVAYQSWLWSIVRSNATDPTTAFLRSIAGPIVDRNVKKRGFEAALFGYDLTQELQLADGILWHLSPDGKQMVLCSPQQVRLNLGMAPDAPLQAVLEPLFPTAEPARTGLGRLFKRSSGPDYRLWLFTMFWLSQRAEDADGT